MHLLRGRGNPLLCTHLMSPFEALWLIMAVSTAVCANNCVDCCIRSDSKGRECTVICNTSIKGDNPSFRVNDTPLRSEDICNERLATTQGNHFCLKTNTGTSREAKIFVYGKTMFKYNPNLVDQCEDEICEFSLSFDESTCSLVEGSVFRNSDCISRKGCPKSEPEPEPPESEPQEPPEPEYRWLGLLAILILVVGPVTVIVIIIVYCRNDSPKKEKDQKHPVSDNNNDYDKPDGPRLKGIRRRPHN